MAACYACDGCGVNVEKPKKVGYVLQRDYCETCAREAEAFLAAEEDNRAHFCVRFEEIRKHLIQVHGKGGSFLLPDVP
jgi:hypothetical protein